MGAVRRCRSCGAEVLWCVTGNGKRMPVDAEPVPDGNVLLTDLHLLRAPLQAEVVPPGQLVMDDGPRYVSHFATCPDADQHRRPR